MKFLWYMISILLWWSLTLQLFAFNRFPEEDTILNDSDKNIVKEDIVLWDGQIRWGMKKFRDQLNGVRKGDLKDGESSREALLNVIKGIINYVLWFIGLIALLYLLYHGIMMLIHPWDEGKTEESRKAMKYAGMAIVGVGVAWFIVSVIFQVLAVVIDATKW